MAKLTPALFLSKWNVRFADNEYQNIEEKDFRELFTDLRDSASFLTELNSNRVLGAPYYVLSTADFVIIRPGDVVLGGTVVVGGQLTAGMPVAAEGQTPGTAAVPPLASVYLALHWATGTLQVRRTLTAAATDVVPAVLVLVSGTEAEKIASYPLITAATPMGTGSVGQFTVAGQQRLFQARVNLPAGHALPTGEANDPNYYSATPAKPDPVVGGGAGLSDEERALLLVLSAPVRSGGDGQPEVGWASLEAALTDAGYENTVTLSLNRSLEVAALPGNYAVQGHWNGHGNYLRLTAAGLSFAGLQLGVATDTAFIGSGEVAVQGTSRVFDRCFFSADLTVDVGAEGILRGCTVLAECTVAVAGTLRLEPGTRLPAAFFEQFTDNGDGTYATGDGGTVVDARLPAGSAAGSGAPAPGTVTLDMLAADLQALLKTAYMKPKSFAGGSQTIDLDEGAYYDPVLANTITAHSAGARVGATVMVILGPNATAPTLLPAQDFSYEIGAYESGKTQLFSFMKRSDGIVGIRVTTLVA